VTGGKLIVITTQFISGVSAGNPLVAFYDIQGGKGEVLFFCSVSVTVPDVWFLYPQRSLIPPLT
jgi:hypothetical protein